MNNLRKFDLNLLVVFEAIYDSGSISHAAKQLNQSQPAISNALSRLRHGVDDPLFVRTRHGMEPTQKAKEMIYPVQEALQQLRSGLSLEDSFDPAVTKRVFRLVMLDHLEAVLMPRLTKKIQDYRSITLESIPLASVSIADRFNDGSLDLLLSTFVSDPPDLECEAMELVELVVIAKKGHPKIDGTLTLDQFVSQGHVALPRNLRTMSRIDEYLFHHKIERHVVYSVSKMWSFPNIVANTELLAILPRNFAMMAAQVFSLDVYPLPFEVPLQDTYMFWKKSRTNDPGHRWLREEILKAHAQPDDMS